MKYFTLIIFVWLLSISISSATFAQTSISLSEGFTTLPTPVHLKGVNFSAGANLSYINNPQFLSEFPKLNVGTMRYPGGTSANNYDWKHGLLDNNRFNFKHAVAFANSMGLKINYVLNYGTTSSHEAAELVRLCNSTSPTYAAKRLHHFGVTDPIGIDVWEMGNELNAKWEWHVSWLAGGIDQYIFYRTGEPALHMPRTTTDSLHYFGGSIWRSGWVPTWSDGMNTINSMLGTFHMVNLSESTLNEIDVEVNFAPILLDSVKVWALQGPLDTAAFLNATQQQVYDVITAPSNLLTPSEYLVIADTMVKINPVTPLPANSVVLVEYKTIHPGAFEIRDSMITADPTIKIGYCVGFQQHMLNTPGFNARLTASPPSFLVEHPYNSTTDSQLNNGYYSEIMHLIDDKIDGNYTPIKHLLDSISTALSISPSIGGGLTEWNIRLCGGGGCDPSYNGILGGLYTANFFAQFYQASANDSVNILVSNHFAIVAEGNNLIHMYHHNASTGSTIVTPQAEATRMVNDVIGDQMLIGSDISITNNPTMTLAKPVVDGSGNVIIVNYIAPALKVYASENISDPLNPTIDVLIINNDDVAGHPLEFNMPCNKVGGIAAMEVLSGDLATENYNISLTSVPETSTGLYSFFVPTFSLTTLHIPYSTTSGNCGCIGDLDGDGIIGVQDLLNILSDFGCLSNCSADLNGDGNVGASDILLFLSLFSLTCV